MPFGYRRERREGDALCRRDQPWRDIRGIGNRLRHGYDALDSAMIWEAVQGCTGLAADCKKAFEQLERDSGGDKP